MKTLKENKGLWANIHAKRKRGEKMRKKGDPGAPTPQAIALAKAKRARNEEMGTTTASIPNPADTAMGPRMNTMVTQDKRKKKRPMVLKRFAKFIEDNGVK